MAYASKSGRARTNSGSPQAFAVCMRCGMWYNRVNLNFQMDWAGAALINKRILVCNPCLDTPQEQLRAIVLPADPVPIRFPSLELQAVPSAYPLGFTQYTLWPSAIPPDFPVYMLDENGNIIYTESGQPIIIDSGFDGTACLAMTAVQTGIPVPWDINNDNGFIASAGVAQSLVGSNSSRDYLAIINPNITPIGVSFGTAAMGGFTTVMIGQGGLLFWATAQGNGAPNPGAMTIVSNWAGSAYYCYEA